ncbi:serine/threonine-protein kinase [Nannocystis pusilla]|uniref:serine/threonine-protein kinase n=1 Tax=Nannocystis pusilla TaxID=889268 RepID=UPI003DA626EB
MKQPEDPSPAPEATLASASTSQAHLPSDMATPSGPTTTDPGLRAPTQSIPGMRTTMATTLDRSGAHVGMVQPRRRVPSDVRAAALQPGTEIDGKYRLEAMLGRGGMGIVWRAEHSHMHGSVAIKFLADRFRHKPQIIERFWQEAKLMGEMGHPNIVRVLDISPATAELQYITMELLTQGSLRDHLKRSGGKLPTDEAVELMDGVLSALLAAHKRGIVHRDIKPDNLMLANIRNFETDTFELGLKVLDFGASLLLATSTETSAPDGLLGTPYYMSPEQAASLQLDQRTDLYSSAVVLYEAIAGKLPHQADDVHSLVYSIATDPATPIEHHVPNITRPFREFFQRALAMDPSARFQSADEMREALRKLSRRLAGKVRNTALYLASGDTGQMPTVEPPIHRSDARMVPFRKALDERPPTLKRLILRDNRPAARPAVIVLGAALGLILGFAIQALRFAGESRTHGVDTLFVCLAFAGLGAGLGWFLPSQPKNRLK